MFASFDLDWVGMFYGGLLYCVGDFRRGLLSGLYVNWSLTKIIFMIFTQKLKVDVKIKSNV